MINFSSYHLSAKNFGSFEEVFQECTPSDTIFSLDANMVIYLREFFLRPRHFIENTKKNKDLYPMIRYFIEQVYRYDLDIDASIGIDESCRIKQDLSINHLKREQTQEAIQGIFSLNTGNIDNFIKNKTEEEPIKDTTNPPRSMSEYLKTDSPNQHILIILYLGVLKLIDLEKRIESNELDRKTACLQFLEYIRSTLDCTPTILQLLAFNVLGGDQRLRKIYSPKSKLNKSEKLHFIFKGALDLSLPNFSHKFVEHNYKKKSGTFTHIFTSTDKRISELNAMINLVLLFDDERPLNYNPYVTKFDLPMHLAWNKKDMTDFKTVLSADFENRFNSSFGTPKTANHLLNQVLKMESIIT